MERSCAAPARLVRSVRPTHRVRSSSQNVSPPSAVPGDSIRPSVGMPCSLHQRSITSSSPTRLGLPASSGSTPRSVTSAGSNV